MPDNPRPFTAAGLAERLASLGDMPVGVVTVDDDGSESDALFELHVLLCDHPELGMTAVLTGYPPVGDHV